MKPDLSFRLMKAYATSLAARLKFCIVLFLSLTVSVAFSQNTPHLDVENPDKFPANDVLVFSRIQTPWSRDHKTYNANHDTVTLKIYNKGSKTLIISKLTLSNTKTWQIQKLKGKAYNSSALPLNIAPGSKIDLTLKFTATDQASRVKVLHETLTIASNDATPSKKISLNGIWQKKGEGSNEPWLKEVLDAFKFRTAVGYDHTDPDKGDPKKLKGDEVLPRYFVRADKSKPVSVRQLSSYQGCCFATERIQWFAKGSSAFTTIATQIIVDAQTVLPRQSSGIGVGGTFTPAGAFGFNVGNMNTTDPSKNPGKKLGTRVYKAVDAAGKIMPNSYILSNDYLGTPSTNYDYNDNTYFVSNVKPDAGSARFSAYSEADTAYSSTIKPEQANNFTTKFNSTAEEPGNVNPADLRTKRGTPGLITLDPKHPGANDKYTHSNLRPFTNSKITRIAGGPEIVTPADDPFTLAESPQVYPNPLHNNFTVNIPQKYQGNCTIQLSDILGNTYQIQKTMLKGSGSIVKVDVSRFSLHPGAYFLKLQVKGEKVQVLKVLIK